MNLIIVLDTEVNGCVNLFIYIETHFQMMSYMNSMKKMHVLLDNEVSQPEVNKITADLCNLL